MTAAIVLALAVALVVLAVAYIARPAAAAAGTAIHAPTAWRTSAPRFRIGTYNIHGGKGLDGRRDLRRCAAVVEGADIVALQEVHAATHSGRRCQAEEIAAANDIGWLYSPARRRWFRDHRGDALLSRFPVAEWRREPLPNVAGHRYRSLTTARLMIGERALWVLFTHLHTGPGRDVQLRRVLERFAEYQPAVLLGDLNTSGDDPQLRGVLSDAAVDAVHLALGTADEPARIDWILAKGIEIITGGSTPAGVSDHPYYWVEARFPR